MENSELRKRIVHWFSQDGKRSNYEACEEFEITIEKFYKIMNKEK